MRTTTRTTTTWSYITREKCAQMDATGECHFVYDAIPLSSLARSGYGRFHGRCFIMSLAGGSRITNRQVDTGLNTFSRLLLCTYVHGANPDSKVHHVALS